MTKEKAMSNPREDIYRELEEAGDCVRRASRIAEGVGDDRGADDLRKLEGEIKTRTDKFDKGAM